MEGKEPEKIGFFKSVYQTLKKSLKISCGCCGRPGKINKTYVATPSTKDELIDNQLQEQSNKIYQLKFENNDMPFLSINNLTERFLPSLSPKNENIVLNKAITKKIRPWSKHEDDLLVILVDKHNGKDWKKVAMNFVGRTAPECNKRWKQLKPIKKRKPWDEEEDKLLVQLVQLYGNDWTAICSKISGRSGKQVRERYINTLDPNINHDKWSKQEDQIILNMYEKIGSKWSEISKYLKNRPENMVKNRFYSHIKKKVLKNHPISDSEEENESFDTMQSSYIQGTAGTTPKNEIISELNGDNPKKNFQMKSEVYVEDEFYDKMLPTINNELTTPTNNAKSADNQNFFYWSEAVQNQNAISSSSNELNMLKDSELNTIDSHTQNDNFLVYNKQDNTAMEEEFGGQFQLHEFDEKRSETHSNQSPTDFIDMEDANPYQLNQQNYDLEGALDEVEEKIKQINALLQSKLNEELSPQQLTELEIQKAVLVTRKEEIIKHLDHLIL